MARLPTSGPLSVSQINALKALGTVQTSLDVREAEYMGDASRTGTANANTAQICMPAQADMNNSPRPGGTASVTWSYTGPSTPWRPVKISDFYGAYNSLPSIAATKINTGDPSGTSGQINVVCSGSDAGAPYSVYYNGTWYIGTSITFNVNTGTHTFYVRDSENCGTNLEFSTSMAYP